MKNNNFQEMIDKNHRTLEAYSSNDYRDENLFNADNFKPVYASSQHNETGKFGTDFKVSYDARKGICDIGVDSGPSPLR